MRKQWINKMLFVLFKGFSDRIDIERFYSSTSPISESRVSLLMNRNSFVINLMGLGIVGAVVVRNRLGSQ